MRGVGAAALRTRGALRRLRIHDRRARVTRVREERLDDDVVRGVTDIFRVLGDSTRLRILHALAGGEMCVYDLAQGLSMSPSAISHQLRLLRALRLVRNRKQGREVYYAVDDRHVVRLMSEVLTHLQHGK
jgi:ArsR family transcriptional regulator